VVGVLTGCGSTSDVPSADDSYVGSSVSEPTATKAALESGGDATIVKAGFGQQDEYVWASALVHNNTSDAGQAVVVSFNLKDAKGAVLATGSQTSGFNWGDQDVPIATQVEVPKNTKVASIEATVVVEDRDISATSSNWGTFEGTVSEGEYGGWSATYHVKNPTSTLIKSPALEEICMDAKGNIIGGTSEFPDLIPASGEIVVTSDNLYLGQRPARCTGYLTPWF
jgi:hypothetical protein